MPLYTFDNTQQSTHETLKISQINIRYENPDIDKLISKIGESDFDVILLQEVADNQHDKIKSLLTYYPYSIGTRPSEGYPSGLALFSRWPIVNRKIHNLGYVEGHVIESIIQSPKNSTPIQIFAIHPGSPRNEALWKLRNATLNYVAHQISSSFLQYKILIGDFNTSPWSAEFKSLESISELHSSADGFGYIPSWSYNNFNSLLRIISSAYIDHCLVSDSFTILNKQYQSINGSDHVLVFTELGLN